jgi:hypothetical protein
MKQLMVLVLVVTGLLGLVPSAQAQESSGVQFFIVPKQAYPGNKVRPKYFFDMLIDYRSMDYGAEDTYFVAANPDANQRITITSNIDVIAVPIGLDNPIGLTALTTVQNKLEGLFVPAGWVTQDTTWREVVGATLRCFLLVQRLRAQQVGRLFESGITLATRINQLSSNVRDALSAAAVSLGLDVSGINGPMTLRQAIRLLATQIPPVEFGGEVF